MKLKPVLDQNEQGLHAARSTGSILIVDSNAFYRLALAEMIKQYNLQCDLCSSGYEALSKVKSSMRTQGDSRASYKLIIIDSDLPDANGCDVIGQIFELLQELG